MNTRIIAHQETLPTNSVFVGILRMKDEAKSIINSLFDQIHTIRHLPDIINVDYHEVVGTALFDEIAKPLQAAFSDMKHIKVEHHLGRFKGNKGNYAEAFKLNDQWEIQMPRGPLELKLPTYIYHRDKANKPLEQITLEHGKIRLWNRYRYDKQSVLEKYSQIQLLPNIRFRIMTLKGPLISEDFEIDLAGDKFANTHLRPMQGTFHSENTLSITQFVNHAKRHVQTLYHAPNSITFKNGAPYEPQSADFELYRMGISFLNTQKSNPSPFDLDWMQIPIPADKSEMATSGLFFERHDGHIHLRNQLAGMTTSPIALHLQHDLQVLCIMHDSLLQL